MKSMVVSNVSKQDDVESISDSSEGSDSGRQHLSKNPSDIPELQQNKP